MRVKTRERSQAHIREALAEAGEALLNFKGVREEHIMTNPILEEIEKLGVVNDNWQVLKGVLREIVKNIPNLSFTEVEEKKKKK